MISGEHRTSIRVEERKLWCGGRLVYNNGILLLLLLLLFHPGSPLWPDPLPAAGSGDVMLAWHKCGSGRDRTPTVHRMCKKIRLIFDPNRNYFAQFFFPLTLLYIVYTKSLHSTQNWIWKNQRHPLLWKNCSMSYVSYFKFCSKTILLWWLMIKYNIYIMQFFLSSIQERKDIGLCKDLLYLVLIHLIPRETTTMATLYMLLSEGPLGNSYVILPCC